jgi:L1 cell adhesion molecule like protein
LLTIEDGVFDVLATNGDTHLGGEDFDNLLVDFCISDFKQKSGLDISKDVKARHRLRNACQKIKCKLSSVFKETLDIDRLKDDEDYTTVITR